MSAAATERAPLLACPTWCVTDHTVPRFDPADGVSHDSEVSRVPVPGAILGFTSLEHVIPLQLMAWQPDGTRSDVEMYVTFADEQIDLTADGARNLASALLELANRIDPDE